MMITRTLTTFKATAYALKFVDGKPAAEELGSAEFTATRADKTTARKAIADAMGKTLPKGVEVIIEEVESVTYGMDLEQFVAMAQTIAVVDKTDAETEAKAE